MLQPKRFWIYIPWIVRVSPGLYYHPLCGKKDILHRVWELPRTPPLPYPRGRVVRISRGGCVQAFYSTKNFQILPRVYRGAAHKETIFFENRRTSFWVPNNVRFSGLLVCPKKCRCWPIWQRTQIFQFFVQILTLIFANIQTNRWSCGWADRGYEYWSPQLPLPPIQEPAPFLTFFAHLF